MLNTLFIIFGILIALAIGFIIGKLISKLKFEKEQIGTEEKNTFLLQQISDYKNTVTSEKNNYEQSIKQLKEHTELLKIDNSKHIEQLRALKDEELEHLRKDNNNLTIQLTKIESELSNNLDKLKDNKAEVEKLQDKFTKEFENLANKILDEKSSKFTEQNKVNIKQILSPLQEKIQLFERKVEDTNKESISRHTILNTQINNLKDLNLQMSKEALNLTKALKGDSKTQGNWGELILERVLEKSGLEKGREYELEKSFTVNEENKTRLRPDVIINLPDNRKMIIDSKVSLTAYEQYVNSESEENAQRSLKDHVNSLKRHIDQLSAKKYEDLHQIDSPDFVLLFIPIEPAFAVALENDNQLYNKAFEKNIVIVTPSTLLATLRTIDSMWRNEKQQQNAIEIATQAGRLFDQFVNLTDDLLKVGNQLNTVQGSYNTTMKKLTGKGNLITKVEKLKTLGIKQTKNINASLVDRAKDE